MTQIQIYSPGKKPKSFFDYLRTYTRIYEEDPELKGLAYMITKFAREEVEDALFSILQAKVNELKNKDTIMVSKCEDETIESALARKIDVDVYLELHDKLKEIATRMLKTYMDKGVRRIEHVLVPKKVYYFDILDFDRVEEIELLYTIEFHVYGEKNKLMKIRLVMVSSILLHFEVVEYDEIIPRIVVKDCRYIINFVR